MKTTLIALALLNFIIAKSTAQTGKSSPDELGIEYPMETNNANHPCISEEQYTIIENRCNENAKIYCKVDHPQHAAVVTQLNWPLKAAAGFNDCSYYYISAHVDQDKALSSFKDYNCGTLTYDGHKGTDIAMFPFPFYKMDNNLVEVVAAAAGTIVDKHDGEFDKNCAGVSSTLTANYMVIQHTDGSRTLYLHMKKNSLTVKTIGQSVAIGEYLAVVGSSGSSSGPHLHFEVWAGSTVSTLVDPFAGSCNSLNNSSWWAIQKPYMEPAVIKTSVNTTDIVLPPCPATETTNESDTYTIPFQGPGLPAGYAKFYIYIRDLISGATATMSILNPNATVFSSWTYNVSGNFRLVYSGFSKKLPTIPGIYTFQATYNGITCSHNFEIINLTGVHETENKLFKISAYPNPFNSTVTIQWNQDIHNGELTFYNEMGIPVRNLKNISGKEIILNRENLTDGFYILRLTSDNHVASIQKLMITNYEP